MKNVLQITYWTVGGFEGQTPIRDALEKAKACGYDGLELAFGAGLLNVDTTRATCQQIRRRRRRTGHVRGHPDQRQLLGLLAILGRSGSTQSGCQVHTQVH